MSFIRVIGFAVMVSLGCAGLRAAAPHPTVLTVLYKDAFHPVVRVIGTDPVILIEGKEKRIRSEPNYLPSRVDHYAEGSVEVLDASIGLSQLRNALGPLPSQDPRAPPMQYGGRADFKATLRSEMALSGGSIAVILYSPFALADTTTPPATEIVVRALPDLPANEPVLVEFTSNWLAYGKDKVFFVQLFDREGRELMSNVASEAWTYYAAVERAQLRNTLRKMRPILAGKDLEARPVLTIRPLLPKPVALPKEPVIAQLSVSVEGTVTDVQVGATSPAAVGQAVREALAGWLFIPRMRGGEPVACNVRIPITF